MSSSTTGHAHLYLDTNLTLEGLTEIIGVLKKYGIVQQGIYNQVKDRGSLTLRPPGVKKGEYPDDEGIEKYKQFFEQPAKDPKVGGYLQPLPFDKKSNIKNLIDDYKKHGFKEKFSIIVPDEVFIDLLKKVCVILSVTSVETYPGAGINVDSIQVKCLGHKIMTVEDILDINAKKLTFDKSDYDNGPSKWPEWEEFIKQIGEKFSV